MTRKTARIIVEIAGGPIIGIMAPTVFVNSIPISVISDLVEQHGFYPHSAAVVATGAPTVFACGSNVARQGDLASCGHPIVGGSDDTFTT